MENQNDKVVVLLSGGLMSTVLMLNLFNQGKNVTALTVVGERTTDPAIRREIQSAMMVCRMFGINHEMIDISSMQAVIAKYNLIDQTEPAEGEAELTEEQLHERARNAVAAIRPSEDTLFAMAMQVAKSLGTEAVFAGKPTPDTDLLAQLDELLNATRARLINAPWAPWKATEAPAAPVPGDAALGQAPAPTAPQAPVQA